VIQEIRGRLETQVRKLAQLGQRDQQAIRALRVSLAHKEPGLPDRLVRQVDRPESRVLPEMMA